MKTEESGERDGKECGKKAEKTAAGRWTLWSLTVPAAGQAGRNGRGSLRARQGSKSKRRWEGWANSSSYPRRASGRRRFPRARQNPPLYAVDVKGSIFGLVVLSAATG